MPQYQQTITFGDLDNDTALAISYQAMKNLNWSAAYAADNKISGSTPKSWKTFGQQILITADGGVLIVSSEMVNGETFDLGGKNKKNVVAFLGQFESVKSNTDPAVLEGNRQAIEILRSETEVAARLEQQQAAEVSKAMNLEGSNLYITYAIIGINLLLFILMAFNGAGIFDAKASVHAQWGSNYSPLTLSGDWWRLLTNIFLHFGIIHLALNMYCLYAVGIFLEPMLGKARYITAYLCTGILASLTSLWWHSDGVNSAGASGAIFGLYGLFLALLTTNLIPKAIRDAQLKSIAIFVVYNLVYGMKGGVDNAAHIGGLISGCIVGYLYAWGIKKEKEGSKHPWVVPAVVIITAVAAYGYLLQNKVSAEERAEALGYVTASVFKDNEKFNERMVEFNNVENKFDSLFVKQKYSDEELVKKISEVGQPLWKTATQIVNSTKAYDISAAAHNKAGKILRYISLRENELELMKQVIENRKEELMPQLDTVRAQLKRSLQ